MCFFPDALFLAVAFSVIILSEALNFTVRCDPLHVQASVRDEANLTCHVVPPTDLSHETFKWSFKWQMGTKVVHTWRSGEDELKHQDEQFEGRTRLVQDGLEAGIISLIISNISSVDEGNYTCMVTIHHEDTLHYPEDVGTVILAVIVKGPNEEIVAPHTTVTPRDDTAEGFSWWWLAIGAIAALVLIVGCIVRCILVRRRRAPGNERDPQPAGNPENIPLQDLGPPAPQNDDVNGVQEPLQQDNAGNGQAQEDGN